MEWAHTVASEVVGNGEGAHAEAAETSLATVEALYFTAIRVNPTPPPLSFTPRVNPGRVCHAPLKGEVAGL